MTHRQDRGFTLIELLLALAIFAIISVGIHGALRMGVDAQRRGEEASQIAQVARQVLWRITADLRAAYTSDGVYGGTLVGEDEQGNDVDLDQLTFTTMAHTPAPDAVGECTLAKVEYFIDDDPDTENSGLQRLVTPVVELAVDEEEEASEAQNYAAEVKSLNFRYYDGTDWADSWDSESEGDLPLAVEVTIGLSLKNEDELRGSDASATLSLRRFSTTVRLQLAHLTESEEAVQ